MTADRYPSAIRPADAEHITIYYDPGYFAGWPFNHGFKAFSATELLISFSRGPCNYAAPFDLKHDVVDARGGAYVTMRSTDGGRAWPLDELQSLGSRGDIERPLHLNPDAAPTEPLDWSAPDFFLTAGFGIPPQRHQNMGYIQVSRDRGHTWEGPYRMPDFGFGWLQVKPDYIVRPDGVPLLFVTVGITGPQRGSRLVAVYASPDSGISWNYLGAIMASSPDSRFVNRYYASPVLLADGRILVALRCQIDARNAWPEIFESPDGGRTWAFVSRPSDWGGPTDLTRLEDGRLLAVYGYRVPPYGIRARVSGDDGRSWGPELILRDDGGSWDLGYPRTALLADGKVISAYYFNRADDEILLDGGVRHIAATIFTP
ncbi:MAG: sialidase family protein [Chloroflexi bacterium]|nr:sialidase family protein [Chloroflexota bacterium]